VAKLGGYVDGAMQLARPLVRPGCLTRGLTLYHCLRRAGLDVSLYFGIGTIEGEVTGHCWVVYQGQPLREPRDPQALFTTLLRFPLQNPADEAPAAGETPLFSEFYR